MGRKRALTAPSPAPKKQSKAVRTCPKAGEPVLLCWLRRFPSFPRLSLSLIREISSYFPPAILLPAVYKERLLTYSVYTRTFTSVPRPCALYPKSQFCLVGCRLALAFDTVNVTAKVVGLDRVAGTVSGFATMRQARKAPATIYLKGAVYVFGGWRNEPMTLCEKYSFQDKLWTSIVDMPNSRGKTHLSIYNNEIYLLPGLSTDPIECFNPRSQTYRTILKPDPASVWKSDLAFIIHSSILLFPDEKHAFEYQITTGRGTRRAIKGGKVRKMAYSALPVLWEDRALWVLAGTEGIGCFCYGKMEGKVTRSFLHLPKLPLQTAYFPAPLDAPALPSVPSAESQPNPRNPQLFPPTQLCNIVKRPRSDDLRGN